MGLDGCKKTKFKSKKYKFFSASYTKGNKLIGQFAHCFFLYNVIKYNQT